jgi:hypothetical protein
MQASATMQATEVEPLSRHTKGSISGCLSEHTPLIKEIADECENQFIVELNFFKNQKGSSSNEVNKLQVRLKINSFPPTRPSPYFTAPLYAVVWSLNII